MKKNEKAHLKKHVKKVAKILIKHFRDTSRNRFYANNANELFELYSKARKGDALILPDGGFLYLKKPLIIRKSITIKCQGVKRFCFAGAGIKIRSKNAKLEFIEITGDKKTMLLEVGKKADNTEIKYCLFSHRGKINLFLLRSYYFMKNLLRKKIL